MTMTHEKSQMPLKSKGPEAQRLMPFAAVVGGLAVMALLYMAFDLVKARMSPCESIFRQTALSLSTKLKFLKAEGELEIGHDKMAELTERAQMTALGLKTCCTVLDAGRLNAEEFMQCKSKARGYEARVEDIAALIAPLPKPARAAQAAEASRPTSSPQQGEVGKKVLEAINQSKAFNQQVTKVRKQQALESLEVIAPAHVDVTTQEREPNNSLLQTNRLTMGEWITGSIGVSGDLDVYQFKTPDLHRDWITVELQNRSTTLEPKFVLYDAEKTSLGQIYKTSLGSDLNHSFVVKPATVYFVQVSSYYGKSAGVYLLRVRANKSYDSYEPNDRVLDAKPIARGAKIKASIMDSNDQDYYGLATSAQNQNVAVTLRNLSTTLYPSVRIYDGNKNAVKNFYSTTAGADLNLAFNAPANAAFFIQVFDYYNKAHGAYELITNATVSKEKAGP